MILKVSPNLDNSMIAKGSVVPRFPLLHMLCKPTEKVLGFSPYQLTLLRRLMETHHGKKRNSCRQLRGSRDVQGGASPS